MSKVTVTARQWEGGWELWNGAECWTQVRRLSAAKQQVRDYLDTVFPEVDHSTVEVEVRPDASLRDVVEARADAARAAAATEAAAKSSRRAVAKLREAGVSGADTAVLMGVTRGRVSQLAKR